MKFGVKNNLCLLCASVAGVLLFCSIFSYFPAFAENIDKININLVKKIGIQRNSVFISKQDIEEIILDGKKILQQKNIENTTTYEINEINNELNLMKISPGYHALQLKFKNISSPVYLPFRLHEKWSNKDKIKAFIYVNKKGELLETENGYDLDMNDNIDDNNDWFRTQTISVKGKIGGLNKRERTLYWYNANKKELRKILLKEEDFFKENLPFETVNIDNKFITINPPLQLSIELPGIYKLGGIQAVHINNMKIPELGIHQYYNQILIDYPYFEHIVSQKPVINLNFSNQIKSFKITIKPKTILILPPPIAERPSLSHFVQDHHNSIMTDTYDSKIDKGSKMSELSQYSDNQNYPRGIERYLIILNIKNSEITVEENK